MITHAARKKPLIVARTGWAEAREVRAGRGIRTCLSAVEPDEKCAAPQAPAHSNVIRGED
ncbi:hypothetical protein AFM16_36315 [Streptomyces antibioticus]|uniref:Uncharacterized protein n=1 Tax=Streptomyces antibioticus TaxID=1890 RepID=A0ABX3LC32_STRAT|nr:hypothetical protein AFM16_36315 [Streptomyces antibioticus]